MPVKKTLVPERKILAKVKIAYDRTLLLPLEEGLQLIRSVASGEMMKSGYKQNDEFVPVDAEISLTLISEQEVKEMKLAKVLESNDDQSSS